MKHIALIFLFSIACFILPSSAPVSSESISSSSFYAPHAPINIVNDSELAAVATSGSGSENNPFILENWDILARDIHGISIANTTAFFIIQNCWIVANGVPGVHGIFLENVADGSAVIFNNICQNTDFGIFLINSTGSRILSNLCKASNEGIYLDHSGNSTVANNDCQRSTMNGIAIMHSANSTVTDNLCRQSDSAGILFRNSSNSIVSDNFLYECGFFVVEDSLTHYLSYSIANTWVNSQPLGWFTNEANMTVSSPYGAIALINCTNVLVTNQNCSNADDGISVLYSSDCQVIRNTFSYHDWMGIFVWKSDSIFVANNTCIQNRFRGIYLLESVECIVTNNTCSQAPGGWWGGGYGIALSSSYSCEITYNKLSENLLYGIYLGQSDGNGIHHNSFLFNNNGETQASDDGSHNLWYDPTGPEGNYWSDYSGSGAYQIDGSAGANDSFPLAHAPLYSPLASSQGADSRAFGDLPLELLGLTILVLIIILGLVLVLGFVLGLVWEIIK
ncbi:MAG: nitrous oxide reductase family maturation protein NosD [Candidatus Thorarchaeota archaeon]